jgi:hypothetical protein
MERSAKRREQWERIRSEGWSQLGHERLRAVAARFTTIRVSWQVAVKTRSTVGSGDKRASSALKGISKNGLPSHGTHLKAA